MSPELVAVEISIADETFQSWRQTNYAQRADLLYGNVVLVKHASNVPQCALAIQELFQQAGAPKGVYTNLFVSGSRIDDVVADPRTKGVSLIGSEIAGASIAAIAGKFLKKSVLELGGGDAFIVLGDADLDKAVEWAVVGRMNNTGQCCVASKRIIVPETVADAFLDKFNTKLTGLKVFKSNEVARAPNALNPSYAV